MAWAGVIFDLDGTLVDSGLDFQAIRRDMGLGSEPILEAMEKLEGAERQRCEEILWRHELAGAERATAFAGAREWIERLDAERIPRAIFTRNARRIADHTLDRVGLPFSMIIAREDAPPKPDPTAINEACSTWNVAAEDVLIIGDYLYDLLAGRAAGTQTALVTRGKAWDFVHLADFVWESLLDGLKAFDERQSDLA